MVTSKGPIRRRFHDTVQGTTRQPVYFKELSMHTGVIVLIVRLK